MISACKFGGNETIGGLEVWVVVQQVRLVIERRDDDGNPAGSLLFLGPGEEDHLPINLTPGEVMSRLGFNNGGGG